MVIYLLNIMNYNNLVLILICSIFTHLSERNLLSEQKSQLTSLLLSLSQSLHIAVDSEFIGIDVKICYIICYSKWSWDSVYHIRI